jgi:hypothetical protein
VSQQAPGFNHQTAYRLQKFPILQGPQAAFRNVGGSCRVFAKLEPQWCLLAPPCSVDRGSGFHRDNFARRMTKLNAFPVPHRFRQVRLTSATSKLQIPDKAQLLRTTNRYPATSAASRKCHSP